MKRLLKRQLHRQRTIINNEKPQAHPSVTDSWTKKRCNWFGCIYTLPGWSVVIWTAVQHWVSEWTKSWENQDFSIPKTVTLKCKNKELYSFYINLLFSLRLKKTHYFSGQLNNVFHFDNTVLKASAKYFMGWSIPIQMIYTQQTGLSSSFFYGMWSCLLNQEVVRIPVWPGSGLSGSSGPSAPESRLWFSSVSLGASGKSLHLEWIWEYCVKCTSFEHI